MHAFLCAPALLGGGRYAFLRAPALLGGGMHTFLRAPALQDVGMYAFLRALALLGGRMYTFLHAPAFPFRDLEHAYPHALADAATTASLPHSVEATSMAYFQRSHHPIRHGHPKCHHSRPLMAHSPSFRWHSSLKKHHDDARRTTPLHPRCLRKRHHQQGSWRSCHEDELEDLEHEVEDAPPLDGQTAIACLHSMAKRCTDSAPRHSQGAHPITNSSASAPTAGRVRP